MVNELKLSVLFCYICVNQSTSDSFFCHANHLEADDYFANAAFSLQNLVRALTTGFALRALTSRRLNSFYRSSFPTFLMSPSASLAHPCISFFSVRTQSVPEERVSASWRRRGRRGGRRGWRSLRACRAAADRISFSALASCGAASLPSYRYVTARQSTRAPPACGVPACPPALRQRRRRSVPAPPACGAPREDSTDSTRGVGAPCAKIPEVGGGAAILVGSRRRS